MSTTDATTDIKLSQRKFWSWIGPCASFLCLIHCFGMGLIAVLAPGLLKFFPHSEALEWSVLAISLASGFATLRKQKAPRWLQGALLGTAATGALSLALGSHPVFRFALLFMGAIPAGLLVTRHRSAQARPQCCEHDHC